jgi:predicted NBD/HSP70 family sugar kinase
VIDVGGTKTLLAVFNHNGEIIDQYKLPTNKNYDRFIDETRQAVKEKLSAHEFKACCCAIPGIVDFKTGSGLSFGNLSWKNVPVKKDLEKTLTHVPIFINNDTKLAGLSEAILLHKKYSKVLYLTVSTGISAGLIINEKIDEVLATSEPGQMLLEHDGKIRIWEDFASGRALVRRYGKRASEIDDPVIWKSFSNNLALGIFELLATIQPEVLVIGGGVGAHLEKFKVYLNDKLEKMESDMVKIPPILKAKRPEEAVIYGCYEFIKQNN